MIAVSEWHFFFSLSFGLLTPLQVDPYLCMKLLPMCV